MSSSALRKRSPLSLCCALAAASLACSKSEPQRPTPRANGKPIAIDGSSTVFPVSEAMAEEFQKHNGARVTVAASGTGGGFKKLCAREIAIAGASRPVKPSELALCKANGVAFVELPIGFDGIAVVVNKQNSWVDAMTVDELKRLWAPAAQNSVKTWADVRKGWPAQEIHLFGAGVDSGTYDYFTKAIVGKEHESRGDYTSSEDDNVLVKGVANDKLALGFFGFAYYTENQETLKIVPIDDGLKENGDGPLSPSHDTIAKGTYQPLSRPIFLYVSKAELERGEVDAFVSFYLGEGAKLVEEVGYVKLPEEASELARQRLAQRTTGSVFANSKVGASVTDLLAGK